VILSCLRGLDWSPANRIVGAFRAEWTLPQARARRGRYCGPGSFFFLLFLSRKLSPFISKI
jgi:hypothetical protein